MNYADIAAWKGRCVLPLSMLALLASSPLLADVVQSAYIKASNTESIDRFGSDVAIDGDTLVVGAVVEDSGSAGVNGNQGDNSAPNSGAVYVFTRNGSVWSQKAYLKASNPDADDGFGASVAISGDTIVVGAPFESSNAIGVNGDQNDNSTSWAGAAYIFTHDGGVWSQQAYLKASNPDWDDRFGYSVAISGDTVVIGAALEDSNATGVNGDQGDNSAEIAGAAYVFIRSGSNWSQQAYLKASNTDADDWFGSSVAISGETVVVGASREDSNAAGIDGDQNNNLAASSGAAYVFVRTGTDWSQQTYLKASDPAAWDLFSTVAISDDTVVVGARWEDSGAAGVNAGQDDYSASSAGAVYVFTRNGTLWNQQAYLKASNTDADDIFGARLAISGDKLVVGAVWEDSDATGINGNQGDNSASYAGAAYLFTRSGAVWNQKAYLKASNTDADDWFGYPAISGDTIVIGAHGEASGANGVGGDQADNSAERAGAAYVFMDDMLFSDGFEDYPKLTINEVDYDQAGSDDASFVELYNGGPGDVSLQNINLVLVDGADDSVYTTYPLPNRMLAEGGFFVFCVDQATVPNCDMEFDDLQDGSPDAVALQDADGVIDTLSYEGSVALPYVEIEGSSLEDGQFASNSLSRFPDGTDTDNNNADFVLTCITPGATNTAEDPAACSPP